MYYFVVRPKGAEKHKLLQRLNRDFWIYQDTEDDLPIQHITVGTTVHEAVGFKFDGVEKVVQNFMAQTVMANRHCSREDAENYLRTIGQYLSTENIDIERLTGEPKYTAWVKNETGSFSELATYPQLGDAQQHVQNEVNAVSKINGVFRWRGSHYGHGVLDHQVIGKVTVS